MLRGDGFKGSGRRFHRVRGELIHVLHIQGSRWGGSTAVNLGVHLTFLPGPADTIEAPDRLDEAACFLRRRMSTVEDMDQWWEHAVSTQSIESALQEITQVYVDHGRAQLERFGQYPESFARFTALDLEPRRPELCGFGAWFPHLHFARIRLREGKPRDALEFAEAGLAACPKQASFLRERLEKIRTEALGD